MSRKTSSSSAAAAGRAAAPDASPPPPPPIAALKPQWGRRWAMIRALLAFCGGLCVYIVALGPDDRLRETAFLGLLALSGSVALGYLGFATQDDRNWMAEAGEILAARRKEEGRR